MARRCWLYISRIPFFLLFYLSLSSFLFPFLLLCSLHNHRHYHHISIYSLSDHTSVNYCQHPAFFSLFLLFTVLSYLVNCLLLFVTLEPSPHPTFHKAFLSFFLSFFPSIPTVMFFRPLVHNTEIVSCTHPFFSIFLSIFNFFFFLFSCLSRFTFPGYFFLFFVL